MVSVLLASFPVHGAAGMMQQRCFSHNVASLAELLMTAAEASSSEPSMEASSSPQPRQCTSLSPLWLWWSLALCSRRACSLARLGAPTSVTLPSTGPAAAASTTHVSGDLLLCQAVPPAWLPAPCLVVCDFHSEAVSGAGQKTVQHAHRSCVVCADALVLAQMATVVPSTPRAAASWAPSAVAIPASRTQRSFSRTTSMSTSMRPRATLSRRRQPASSPSTRLSASQVCSPNMVLLLKEVHGSVKLLPAFTIAVLLIVCVLLLISGTDQQVRCWQLISAPI